MIVFIWIGLCVIIGFAGSNKNIGYWGTFFLSLLLSPLIGLIIALCSGDKKPEVTGLKSAYKCKHCDLISQVNSHYCPRCFKDSEGYTAEQNKERFSDNKIA